MKFVVSDVPIEEFISAESDPTRVHTTSRLRKWWLSNFRGYTVTLVRSRPEKTRLGGVRYTTIWSLAPTHHP